MKSRFVKCMIQKTFGQPAAARAGVATCLAVRTGGHDFDLWSQALSDAFPWIAWRLGLTGEPEHEPATCVSP